MIGICTRYQKHDTTFAALSIARHLHNTGHDFSILCREWRAREVMPEWDSHISQEPFEKWLKDKQLLIWTEPVDDSVLDYVLNNNIYNYLYTSWDHIHSSARTIFAKYARVLAPTATQALLFKDKFNLKNVHVLPYYPHLPITNKLRKEVGKLHIFLSIYGTQLRRVEISVVTALAEVSRVWPNLYVTIGCSKGLARYTKTEFKALKATFKDRWNILYDCNWHEQVKGMANADMTVWLPRYDGFGIIPITSLHVGTPVIAWDALPASEHMFAGINSLLVPCEIEMDWFGMPKVVPNYDEFKTTLISVLKDNTILSDLLKSTYIKVEDRDLTFIKGWNNLLPT